MILTDSRRLVLVLLRCDGELKGVVRYGKFTGTFENRHRTRKVTLYRGRLHGMSLYSQPGSGSSEWTCAKLYYNGTRVFTVYRVAHNNWTITLNTPIFRWISEKTVWKIMHVAKTPEYHLLMCKHYRMK